ncbi:hypothetical protein ACLOJK_006671 [Asimina triloba]
MPTIGVGCCDYVTPTLTCQHDHGRWMEEERRQRHHRQRVDSWQAAVTGGSRQAEALMAYNAGGGDGVQRRWNRADVGKLMGGANRCRRQPAGGDDETDVVDENDGWMGSERKCLASPL